jgi:hypothetical protein
MFVADNGINSLIKASSGITRIAPSAGPDDSAGTTSLSTS